MVNKIDQSSREKILSDLISRNRRYLHRSINFSEIFFSSLAEVFYFWRWAHVDAMLLTSKFDSPI